MDSRMDIYGQSETNIIEVEENYSVAADAVVITGGLIDYNRGVHAKQTHKECFTKIQKKNRKRHKYGD